MDRISLSESEWTVMKTLWERSPLTLGEVYSAVNREKVWTRATVYVMLKRLIAKGAVGVCGDGRVSEYRALVGRPDAAAYETMSLIDRVYDGSVEMLFASLTERKPLSDREIDELQKILDNARNKEERGKKS